MHLRVAQRLTIRSAIALTICTVLLSISNIQLLITSAAQNQRQVPADKGKPKPGKPEGVWPDLDELMRQSQREPKAPPPIPSTIRSERNDGKPWDGRRVGDPEPRFERGGSDLASSTKRVSERRSNQTRRAHARARMMTPTPPPPHDQFVHNFFNIALVRSPASDETSYWYDQLRVAYANGSTPLKLASIELGRTLFESAEYAARNRNAHWYVYDLYKTYLMREPDPGGWAMWEGLVPTHGREYVRRGFEESGEFATLTANITTSGSPSSNAASLISARVDPRNQPGRGMLSRDASWSVPLISLPGRAGLDLGLALSYSSMVWTRSGPYIYFDEDNGFPSPGFRLGFPSVQRKAFDVQTGKNAYLLVSGNGQRVELRQVGSSNIYDAADSSYLRLTEDGAVLRVHSTDGTRLSFTEANGEYRCVEIKDRNGNYLTINNNALGQINTITDTLGRILTFHYDDYDNPASITQMWGGEPHDWATFGWGTHTMQSSFGSLRVIGTANNATLPVLTQVGLPDTDRYVFEYTNAAQVSVIRRYRAGGTQPFYNVFQYESTTNDTPRLSETRVAAENWTSLNGVPGEVTTYFAVDTDGACRMTAPDGTIYKEYYGTGWQKGLTTLSEVWSGGVRQKWTTTAWTQDNTAVSYEVNPRVTETNVYDSSGNRRRTTIDYGIYAQWGLPYSVVDYAADGVTAIRNTITDYNLNQVYLDRRLIGLVSAIHQTDIVSWQRKIGFTYDDAARLHAVPAAATQHDTSYNTSLTVRGNLTAVSRWDVEDIVNPAKALTTYTNYYTTGTLKSTTDPAGHQSSITYGDSFSDTGDRNTFAYPTTFTDADNFSLTIQYNFNFGGKTRTEGPPPAGQSRGAIQTITYDTIGRVDRITTVNNNAYTRYVYGANFVRTFSTVNNTVDEMDNMQVFDGVGRVIASFSNHPGSDGHFRAQMTIYDRMGRAVKTSNPTEITGAWVATGDDSAGWLYTEQTYDWQGRPLRTTHPDPDATYREVSYSGCGCAGGEVVTLTDEGTIDGGVPKRRQQKIYSDVLGRTVKTEILNWQNGPVYSATVNEYNARDQIKDIKQYAGTATAGNPYQQTTLTYDGYGRLKTKHLPQESPGTQTTWTYNSDDTINTMTDARGAVSTFGYVGTNRGLVKTLTQALPGKPTINITFAYDAVGNRTSMVDQSGSATYGYNELSQLTSELKTLGGTQYTLSYDYNLTGQLKKMTYPGNITINYLYDTAGRVIGVTGSDTLYQGITQYASAFTYRASGARKTMTDGANRTSTVTYDARLRPATFQISGGVANQSYEYYEDGRNKFVHNLSDANFDRFYSYDHADRLKLATTGGDARGDSGAIPYREEFGYNVWGDTTSRVTETWTTQGFADAGTYVNRRRAGWEYENDGRIKTIDTRTYSYDPAGNRVSMTGQIWSGSNYFSTSTTMGYDGDGAKVEEVSTWPTTFTTRYLRSNVLGGEIVQETNSAGQTIRYVYLPDGTQLSTLIGSAKWKHETPGRTGLYETFQSGFVNRVEFDPMRGNVGLTAPPPPDTNGGDGDIGSNHNGGPADSRFSNMANPAAGCFSVGGVDLPCTWSSFDLFEFFVWGPARQPAISIPSDTPRVWVPGKKIMSIVVPPNPFDQFLENPVQRIDTNETRGYWQYAPAPFRNITFLQNPQKTNSPLNLQRARDLIQKNLTACVREKFGFNVNMFNPATEIRRGSVLVTGPDVVSNGGNDRSNIIITDQFTLSLADIKWMTGKSAAGFARRGTYGGVKYTPYTNYAAKDLVSAGKVSQENIGLYLVGIQIHELGNSLAMLAGWGNRVSTAGAAHPGAGNDTDAGSLLSYCVFGGHISPTGTLQK